MTTKILRQCLSNVPKQQRKKITGLVFRVMGHFSHRVNQYISIYQGKYVCSKQILLIDQYVNMPFFPYTWIMCWPWCLHQCLLCQCYNLSSLGRNINAFSKNCNWLRPHCQKTKIDFYTTPKLMLFFLHWSNLTTYTHRETEIDRRTHTL